MKKWLSLILLALVFAFVINAESRSAQHFECLGNFDEFLYLGDKPYPLPAPAPLPPWKLVTISKSIPYPGYAEVAIARVYNGKTEIWMNVAPDEYSIEPTEIVINYPDTKEKVNISTETNLEGVRVDRLFVDHSGTVWGRNRWFRPLIADPPYGEVPVFSTYDERTRACYELQTT